MHTEPSQLLGSMERQGMYDGVSGCVLFDYIQNSEKRHCEKHGRVGIGFGIKKTWGGKSYIHI